MSRARRRLVSLTVAIFCLALVVAGVTASMFGPGRDKVAVAAEFETVVGLYPGSDVRALGVRIGTVTRLEPRVHDVVVHMEVDSDVAIAATSHAAIVAPTLVSDRYVQFTELWESGDKLENGAQIPVDRTAVPVEIDELYESVNEMARVLGPDGANREGAVSDLITVGADNLEGNGEAIRELLTHFGSAARTMDETSEDFFGSLENFEALDHVLLENDQHLRQLTRSVAELSRTIAQDRDTLVEALQLLGPALATVESFIEENREHLDSSVTELSAATAVLVERQNELDRLLRVAPIAVNNVLAAYDPNRRMFIGRGNPLDVTLNGRPNPGVQDPGRPDMKVEPQPQGQVNPRVPLLIPDDEGAKP